MKTNDAQFWAEARIRISKVREEAEIFLKFSRESNWVFARHVFVRMRTPVQAFFELFEGGVLAIGSPIREHALNGTAHFANAFNGYSEIRSAIIGAPERILELAEAWHASLTLVLKHVAEKQKEVAECN